MNKDKLVDSIAEKLGSTKAEAERVINVALDEITTSTVSLPSDELKGRIIGKERAGVNPRTGEKIQIAAIKVPKFRAGKNLKEAVR
ncbi:MAG: Histone family protein DNA-binding protein [Candidatus Azambacteria bacterium GW2011_GWE1_42_9]|nr:MAG: Histone family protein DNA-binding protein [Candidatus Azambacteria bacterium GW2011_GWE1_42_9]